MSDPEQFSYRTTRDGRVFISWRGRQMKVLAGKRAHRLAASLSEADPQDRQVLLARATGNFRRGTER
jgi:hypothetical protein